MCMRLQAVSADPFMDNTAIIAARYVCGKEMEPTRVFVQTAEGEKILKVLRYMVVRPPKKKNGGVKAPAPPIWRYVVPMPNFLLKMMIGMNLEVPD